MTVPTRHSEHEPKTRMLAEPGARRNLTDLFSSIMRIRCLKSLKVDGNPLNPELVAAYKEGFDAVKRYLRAKAESQVVLNESKLILIGEGEVGKSCLLGALRGDPWEELVGLLSAIRII